MAKTCSIGLKSGEYFGGAVNVTDGQTSYHRFPADLATQDIFQYTLMPTHITARFCPPEAYARLAVTPRGIPG